MLPFAVKKVGLLVAALTSKKVSISGGNDLKKFFKAQTANKNSISLQTKKYERYTKVHKITVTQ